MNINIYKVTFLLYQLLIFLNLFIIYLSRQRDWKKKSSTCWRLVTFFFFLPGRWIANKQLFKVGLSTEYWPWHSFNTALIFTSEVYVLCKKSIGAEGDAMNFDIPWNLVKEHMLHNFTKTLFLNLSKSNSKDLNGEYLVLAICYFQLRKKSRLQNFYSRKKLMMLEIVNKNVFETMTLPIIWYLFQGFKTVILCSVHSIWFKKYVFC